jgi:hypothetical protein
MSVRVMKAKDGTTLVKRVTVRIFHPYNKRSGIRSYSAKAGKGINELGIQNILDSCGEFIEKKFPGHEYRLVELGMYRYNFVWECEKEASTK